MKYTANKFRKATSVKKLTKYVVNIALRHLYENMLTLGTTAATAMVSYHCLDRLKLARSDAETLKPLIEEELTSLGFENVVVINGETIEITVSWKEEEEV